MTKVVNLPLRISRDNREHRPGECTHRHINLDSHGGTVTCVTCKAVLSPFWALSMLSAQYELALDNIDRLTKRITSADVRIADLSTRLDGAQPRSKDASENNDREVD